MSRTRSASRRAWSRSRSMRKPSLCPRRTRQAPGNRAQRKVNSKACSTFKAATVKEVPLRLGNSVVKGLTNLGKLLRKLPFQILLGGLGRRQNRLDLEVIHGAEGADAGTNQNLGGGQLELFA